MVGKLKDILVTVMKVSGEEIVKVCRRGSCFLKETERESETTFVLQASNQIRSSQVCSVFFLVNVNYGKFGTQIY